MKKTGILLLLIITYLFTSCGNDTTKQPKKEIISSVNRLKPASEKIIKKSTIKKSTLKELTKRSNRYVKDNSLLKKENEEIPEIQNLESRIESTREEKAEIEKNLISIVNLKKILSNSEIGETLTQKELTKNFQIPREAVKIVKSITKTAEDEIAIKWKSTWLLEKVSDAKFKDGIVKIAFRSNKLYTSGDAIGIKYEKKIYNNLVIIGSSAYITNVKGYRWQIGR